MGKHQEDIILQIFTNDFKHKFVLNVMTDQCINLAIILTGLCDSMLEMSDKILILLVFKHFSVS